MHAAVERRNADQGRVPFDMAVELRHELDDEPFSVDGIDVSAGGLSLRSSVIPDIGSRVACRFACPPDGEPIEADGEVVWAKKTGSRMGDFGVRFVGLDPRVEEEIRLWAYEQQGVVARAARLGAAGVDEGVKESEIKKSDLMRLKIDGVPSPIVSRLKHDAQDLVIVEQELPFLRLGSGLTVMREEGERRGKLESIELSIDGEIPKLTLAVSYEAVSATHAEPNASDRHMETPAAERTWPDLVSPVVQRSIYDTGAGLEEREAQAVTALEEAASRLESASGTAPVGGAHHANVELDDPFDARPRAKRRRDEDEARAMPLPPRLLDDGLPQATSIVASMRAFAVAVAAKLVPLCSMLLQKLVAFVRDASERSAPVVRSLADKGRHHGMRAAGAVADRFQVKLPFSEASAPRRKRTTAVAPQERAQIHLRKQHADEELELTPRNRRRTLMLSIIGAVVVGAGVYAFMPSSSDDEIELHREVEVSASAPTAAPVAAPAPGAMAAPSAPSPELPQTASSVSPYAPPPVMPPMPPIEAPQVQVPMPTAMPAPSYVAGPMPAPTYPGLPSSVRPTEPPATVPAASPYAVDVRGASVERGTTLTSTVATSTATPTAATSITRGPMSFGAASVANARTHNLRMSAPVTSLRGAADAGGFTVVVMGALSLDRAAPISASNPNVASARILNKGNYAELTIRFAPGRRPAYRVSARGTTLEVTIQR